MITGLLAAVIGAGVVTASELAIFGHQIGNSERSTGLLGGNDRTKADEEKATPTPDGDRGRDGHARGHGDRRAHRDGRALAERHRRAPRRPAVAPPTEATPPAPTPTP